MLLPHLPLVNHLMPAKGTYRVIGARVDRRLMPGVWITVALFPIPAHATRFIRQLKGIQ
jgi:hypothetical protein